ncbi:DUF4129 domain-containing protein [Tautonia rosea]|uniref:DUF4129 domain-containing protein n=1 Tax=Tautonia rosea TaxID=2728037 RepID=UPI001473A520|nr:DUF4129 domain-containing protein [Tautonia rosea]
MVSRMVGWIALVVGCGPLSVVLGFADSDASSVDPEAVEAVRQAFTDRSFPWYDERNDAYRPVMPPRPPSTPNPRLRGAGGRSWFDWPSMNLEELGRLIIFVLLAAGLTALILYLARTWQRRIDEEAKSRTTSKTAQVIGSAARVGSLPTGLVIDESDPLEAARQLRTQGERGRAVVLLFAHQLLVLDQMSMIRLSPGRTGRQLVRTIEDDVVRGVVGRTLRMFEAVYYGHQEPDAEEFEALWAEAESLDAMFASGVVQ